MKRPISSHYLISRRNLIARVLSVRTYHWTFFSLHHHSPLDTAFAKNMMLSFPDPSSESQMWLFRFLQQGACVKKFIDNCILCQSSDYSCLFCKKQYDLRNTYVHETDCLVRLAFESKQDDRKLGQFVLNAQDFFFDQDMRKGEALPIAEKSCKLRDSAAFCTMIRKIHIMNICGARCKEPTISKSTRRHTLSIQTRLKDSLILSFDSREKKNEKRFGMFCWFSFRKKKPQFLIICDWLWNISPGFVF